MFPSNARTVEVRQQFLSRFGTLINATAFGISHKKFFTNSYDGFYFRGVNCPVANIWVSIPDAVTSFATCSLYFIPEYRNGEFEQTFLKTIKSAGEAVELSLIHLVAPVWPELETALEEEGFHKVRSFYDEHGNCYSGVWDYEFETAGDKPPIDPDTIPPLPVYSSSDDDESEEEEEEPKEEEDVKF